MKEQEEASKAMGGEEAKKKPRIGGMHIRLGGPHHLKPHQRIAKHGAVVVHHHIDENGASTGADHEYPVSSMDELQQHLNDHLGPPEGEAGEGGEAPAE